MSYETRPGQPYAPKFRIVDGFGSPITSGITGTMTVYGPASATTSIATGSLTHLGDGFWGLSVAGSLLTSLGTYPWLTGAITGTATLAAQRGSFRVGVGDLWTLREVYTGVRRALRDGDTGTTTGGGSTTSLVCSKFAWGSNNAWIGSEIYLLEPANTTDLNPVTVTAFTAATGTFTFAGQAITSTVAGQDFIIGNREGQGWKHDEVLDAITTAIRRQRVPRRVSSQVALTTAWTTYEYALPTDWLGLDMVEYLPDTGLATDWRVLPPATYDWLPETGILRLPQGPPNNALRIWGYAAPQAPATMTDLVQGDGATIRDDALYELLSASDDIADQRRAAALGGGVMRARMGAGLARM